MVVGYGGRKIIMENNDTSYYGRILIKALATNYPDNYYILYSPENESNKRLTALFNEDSVRVKFPRNHIHNKERWYTGNGKFDFNTTITSDLTLTAKGDFSFKI